MQPKILRPLPIRVRPGHRETAESYLQRLYEANLLPPGEQEKNVKAFVRTGEADSATAREVLAEIRGGLYQGHFARSQVAGLEHHDGSSCPRCTTGLNERYACKACVGEESAVQYPHLDGNVCLRHKLWIAPGVVPAAQHRVGNDALRAERKFRRLVRTGRVDAVRFAELLSAFRRWGEATGNRDCEHYGALVDIAGIILSAAFQRRIFDPRITYAEGYDLVEEAVRLHLQDNPVIVVDAIWAMLRPGHLLVRECLEYGRVLDDMDPHAFRPAIGRPGVFRPLEPFARHLGQIRTCAVDAWDDLNLRRYNYGPRDFDRSKVAIDSSGIAQYICDNGHRVAKAPNQMNIAKLKSRNGCGVCRNAVVLPGFNSAAQTHPWLAAYWSDDDNGGLTLDEVYGAGEYNKYNLRCSKGHLWPTVLGNVTVRGYGCPTCSGRFAIPGETSLAALRPDLLASWNWELNRGIDPDTVTSKSGSKFWWLCSVSGHPTWPASALNRANGRGCPTCSNKNVVAGLNDFVTRFPEAASEWAYDRNSDDPTRLGAYDRKSEYWWRCKKEHFYRLTVSDRTVGRGCQYCADKLVWTGYNDVATRFADIVGDWDHERNDGVEPSRTLAGSRKWNWECHYGHRRSASAPHRRTSGGCTDCPKSLRIASQTKELDPVPLNKSRRPQVIV